MKTISKNKYSAELTNTLREFLKSKYEYTELDAIKAGINSQDYLDWDNPAEDDFVSDVHALWIGEAVIDPEDERNYYKMAKAKSTEENDLYLGLRNDELFLTPKFDFAHKFTEDDLHTALIKAKLCLTSITKVKKGNEADGRDSNPPDVLTESDGITIDAMKTLSTDEFRDYLKGNIIKYVFRTDYKEDSNKDEAHKAQEDLDKAIWYINKLRKYV